MKIKTGDVIKIKIGDIIIDRLVPLRLNLSQRYARVLGSYKLSINSKTRQLCCRYLHKSNSQEQIFMIDENDSARILTKLIAQRFKSNKQLLTYLKLVDDYKLL